LAGPEDLSRVAGALEAVNGLAHLADRSPLEVERVHVDDRLVAVVERVQPAAAVEVETRRRGTEDRETPVARVGERDEAVDERRKLVARADRIAGDDRHPADDAVGEERPLALAEEVRLVGAERERRERVDPPRGDERAG